jgi:hypothetical protein
MKLSRSKATSRMQSVDRHLSGGRNTMLQNEKVLVTVAARLRKANARERLQAAGIDPLPLDIMVVSARGHGDKNTSHVAFAAGQYRR